MRRTPLATCAPSPGVKRLNQMALRTIRAISPKLPRFAVEHWGKTDSI
jgi:hypothetical protein